MFCGDVDVGVGNNTANSSSVMAGCWCGSSRKYQAHMIAQTRVTAPTMKNELRHENETMRNAIMGGHTALPSLADACVTPCAQPRRSRGIHWDTARVATGKVAPSPAPRTMRAIAMEIR